MPTRGQPGLPGFIRALCPNCHEVDVAVDPIEGTSLTASGLPGAISVVALAERGSMFTTHAHYMLKLVVGRRSRGVP